MLRLTNFILFFFLIINSVSYSENKVAYIDLDLVLSDSDKGKELLKKINNNEKLKFEEFEKKELKFKNDEKKILASKNIISQSQLDSDINSFKKEINNYKVLKSNELKKLGDERNKAIVNFFKLINPLIQKFMEKNSISILMDKKIFCCR